LFWFYYNDRPNNNLQYKRNSKSSDTELLPGATIYATIPLRYLISASSLKVGHVESWRTIQSYCCYWLQTQVINDVFLELGKPFNVDILLKMKVSNLAKLNYWFKKQSFSKGRTGAETIGRKN
jgi:hypothetical protein